MIRYDGLYATEPQDDYRYYLRFFPTGQVASASVVEPSTAHQVGQWLGMPGHNDPTGSFQVRENSLSFETVNQGWVDYRDGTESEEVRVEYEGFILGDGSLMLQSHSLATGHRDELTYRFESL